MQLSILPRRRYTSGCTPIEPLERLSAHLGGPKIYVKRDDLTGLAAGGNKTRKLEFLVADALAAGCDTLVTTGAIQSNHCRLTLAAAAREGLRCRLVLRRATPEPYSHNGNRLLFSLLGVEDVSFVDTEEEVEREMERIDSDLTRRGRRGYFIPVGGSNALGTIGYVACGAEILSQAFELGIIFDHVICTTGSCGTHAGLVAGLWASGVEIPVTGINISRPAADRNPLIQRLAHEALRMLGSRYELPNSAIVTRDEWIGPAYAVPTREMINALQLVARTEGILLDPVYSGKAMAGLISMIEGGELRKGQTVLFLHTGGAPALYAYQEIFDLI